MAKKGPDPNQGPPLSPEEVRAIGEPDVDGVPSRYKIINPHTGELIWQSQAGSQTDLFFLSENPADPCDEILLGGMRGVGKSQALIAWMAVPIGFPEYNGMLLRYSQEANKQFIDACWEIYSKMGAKREGRPVAFRWPNGAVIFQTHLKDERSIEALKGHSYQRVGVEEVTQIPNKNIYLKMLGINRTASTRVPRKIMLTSNPDGPLHDFIKKRFVVVYDKDGLVPHKRPFHDPVEKRVRVYIPGNRDENKILLEANPDYYEQFNRLPPHIQRAWVYGDWDAPLGAFFPEFRPHGPLLGRNGMEPPEANHVIQAQPLPPWCHRWAAMDWGYSHHTAAYWGCRGPDKRVHVYREMVARKHGSDVLGAEFAKLSEGDLEGLPEHHLTLYLSPDAFAARDRDKTIAEQIQYGIETILGPGSTFLLNPTPEEKELQKTDPDAALTALLRRREELGGKVAITVRRANAERIAGWSYMRQLLRWERLRRTITPDIEHAQRLLQVENGFVKYHAYMSLFKEQEDEVLPRLLIHDNCPLLIATVPRLIPDEKRMEDVLKFDGDDEDVGDDPADAARYLFMAFQDYEAKVPYPVWMEREMGKFFPRGLANTDLDTKIMVAVQAADRYRKQTHQEPYVFLPRESMAMRG